MKTVVFFLFIYSYVVGFCNYCFFQEIEKKLQIDEKDFQIMRKAQRIIEKIIRRFKSSFSFQHGWIIIIC
jgi:hypothetical protein